jgi:hypothetical protein
MYRHIALTTIMTVKNGKLHGPTKALNKTDLAPLLEAGCFETGDEVFLRISVSDVDEDIEQDEQGDDDDDES